MAHGGENDERRASVFEIVGAWLHIWVPPRDVEIPPVPWRKLGIGFGIGAVVLAAALAVMIPRIDDGKDRRSSELRAQQERSIRKNRQRVMQVQRPLHGEAPSIRPPADASPVERQAARESLVARVEAAILADARERSAPVAGPTDCKPTPGTATGRAVGAFDCFAIKSRIAATAGTSAAISGYPYRAVVDFQDFRYTWCKVEPTPGEKMVLAPDEVTGLPPECLVPKGI